MGTILPTCFRFQSRLLAAAFGIYVALTALGWVCLLLDEETVPAYLTSAAAAMLLGSAVMALVAALVWGIWNGVREKRQAGRLGLNATFTLFATFILFPLFLYSLLGLLITVPYWIKGRVLSEQAQTARAAASPDGQWSALVINKPAFDGPNHDLYLRRSGQKDKLRVARLASDVDYNEAIHWSPRGEVVVFANHYDLFAVRLPDLQSAVVPLGGRKVTRPNGTFFIQGQPAELSAVSFPSPGVINYTIKDTAQTHTIPTQAFVSHPSSYALDPFASQSKPAI